MSEPTHHMVDARGVTLHAVTQGEGPAVLFCHGFPSTWEIWRSAMAAAAGAGFRAIALDMRGYGDSAAPAEAEAYTPFHTVGDLIALLDHVGAARAIVVGHDFGGNAAWSAAMMRPDRIAAVFAVSVVFQQPGGPSFLDRLRAAGQDGFYMFANMKPEADAAWADAAHSITAVHYWLSGEPPAEQRWDPLDPARHMLRPAPHAARSIDPAYIEATIRTFARTGFHAPLNYYRAFDPYFAIANRAYAGARIAQPSFFLTGEADGLNSLSDLSEEAIRRAAPGLTGTAILDGIGHWPQLEAPERFNRELLRFLAAQAHLA